ncbi:MAG: 30S ribosomal protein S9 [Actinobacteria bacterium]|nr:30S ribosomal protein S9 [Cyanobacteriota bacterium]MCL5770825.1 30S ribosomal protein S9 [Actinomycetota bacterium]
MAEEVKYYATGRRKESTARVWIKPGEGKIIVNNRDFKEYFPRETIINSIIEPFNLTGTLNAYDVIASIEGGGISGQAGALRHGISRALLEINPEYRIILKKEGFLTRDSRIKERKKYGLKKARKRPQYSKR